MKSLYEEIEDWVNTCTTNDPDDKKYIIASLYLLFKKRMKLTFIMGVFTGILLWTIIMGIVR